MPYDYSKLTPQEKEKVLHNRRQQGYPLHAPPHPFRKAGYFLITSSTFEHQPVMLAVERRTEFEISLLASMKSIQADCISWVVLPNHYHILIDVDSLDSVSDALKLLHGTTSRQWNLEDHLTGKRKVWYKYSDRWMRSEKQLHQTFNYVHYNPVKHDYVEDMYEWKWSSLKMYTNSMGNDWLRQRWISSPPGKDLGKEWDEYDK